MLPALLALQAVTLLLLAVLLLRRSRPATAPDLRREALLAADLPGRLLRSDARVEALERYVQSELAQFRQETAGSLGRQTESTGRNAEALRTELVSAVGQLGEALRAGLERARQEHRADAERLRTTVEGRLDKLNDVNAAKLEEMRVTVDEKLHSTLQTRLTESFGAVTDQLTKVHSGLGEMSKLSAGVDDLSRIFTNVKSRGSFAEVQLGMLLSQMLAPNQFSQNVKVRPNTGEMVEYAVKLPTPTGDALLPIDAKFPREAWERLESAYVDGTPAEIAAAGRSFETAIRTEGRRICDKYIAPPATTHFAIMFLPTEGLYAEVMRRDGLQADIQQNCRVTIAGPSTLSAILNSFQMGFHMLQLQRKGDEVWTVLAAARTQFGKFEDLMNKMDDQVSKVQKTIQEVGTRTRVITRTLRDVSVEGADTALNDGREVTGSTGPVQRFDGFAPVRIAPEN